MTAIAERYAAVLARVASACESAGRRSGDVRVLLAVKTQPTPAIRQALAAGATLLGHNRVQELVATGPELAQQGVPPHAMHVIGHLQSNKVAGALRWATCVETVDSASLAEKLSAAVVRRRENGEGIGGAGEDRPLDVMVQVNTSGERTKFGVAPEDASALVELVGGLQDLRLIGLMTIGARSEDAAVVRRSFDDLARLRAQIATSGAPGTAHCRELSMGMSADLELAVAAGATIVRVGTAVFGARP